MEESSAGNGTSSATTCNSSNETNVVPKKTQTEGQKTHLSVIPENQSTPIFVDDSEEEESEDSSSSNSDEEEEEDHHRENLQRSSSPALTRANSETRRNRRRRSAITLMKNAFGASNLRLQTGMDLVRENFTDTYQREGNAILLHGYLHIQITRATNLRNTDCFRSFHRCCKCISKDVSDPYVTVHAGAHRLIKTKQIDNDLNPVWNQEFFLPICHPIEHIEFRVKDRDNLGSELLGKTFLSVHELIRFANKKSVLDVGSSDDEGIDDDDDNSDGLDMSASNNFSNNFHNSGNNNNNNPNNSSRRLLRTGVHKKVHLDGKPQHGTLEYFVEFIPKDLLHAPPKERGLLTQKSPISLVVPGVYFPLRQNNRIRLYIDADDKGQLSGTPSVSYGVLRQKVWKPNRFFRDVYDSICQAQHMVYIVGWSVDYTISLLRGKEETEGLSSRKEDGFKYSSNIGELLNQKADEGVVVNMLVWDDQTSNTLNRVGFVATMDEQLRDYFRGTKVNLRLVPMAGGNKTNVVKRMRNSLYYTHHQKCVICDTPRKELVAYVGGIDLTYGRYDDGTYALFRTLNTLHKADFHNACVEVDREMGPREPWHDIHSRVEGLGTLDLLQNFEERWIGQGGLATDLVVLADKGIQARNPDYEGEDDEREVWNTQLFRSIDERTAKLRAPAFKTTAFDEIKGVEFGEEKKIKAGKRKTIIEHILKTGKEREQRFVANAESKDATKNLEVARPLDVKRDLRVDSSAHKALVHHIRNAQHSLYMESQYFLSSSFLWPHGKTDKCCNLVAAEIAFKICEKIEAGERFAAYIVVPMWPEGLPLSSSVQDILAYQSYTMSSMYQRIANSIARWRKKLESEGNEQQINEFKDIKPTDYLNFYCLATRESPDKESTFGKNGVQSVHLSRRHLVYTHSKMTIVDDTIALIGSANINQRSLDGNRDSELLMGLWQPAHIATKDSVPTGDIHGFRLHCFAHVTGTMDDTFRNPSSLHCVRRVNAIAEENWKKYTQVAVVEMTSTIIPYPVRVSSDGSIEPATANGKFPDTSSSILGKPGSLPKFLTT